MKVIQTFGRCTLLVLGGEFMLFGGLMALVFALWTLGLTRLDHDGRPTSSGEIVLAANLLAMSSAQAWLGWKLVRGTARVKALGQAIGNRSRYAERLRADHAVEEPVPPMSISADV